MYKYMRNRAFCFDLIISKRNEMGRHCTEPCSKNRNKTTVGDPMGAMFWKNQKKKKKK